MPFTHAYTGSNPVRVTIKWRISSAGRASALQAEGRRFEPVILHHLEPLAQLVEHLTFNQRVEGSSPVGVIHIGGLAQLGEHLPYKQRVGGSIPSSSTIFFFAGVAQLVEQLTCNQ